MIILSYKIENRWHKNFFLKKPTDVIFYNWDSMSEQMLSIKFLLSWRMLDVFVVEILKPLVAELKIDLSAAIIPDWALYHKYILMYKKNQYKKQVVEGFTAYLTLSWLHVQLMYWHLFE